MKNLLQFLKNSLLWEYSHNRFYFSLKKMALGRHIKERTVCGNPNFVCFTPQGCEKTVETVQLFCDELEAMRLKHEQGLDIVQGGESMGVSKSTFARIYERAIGKVTDALVHGKVISIQKRCYIK